MATLKLVVNIVGEKNEKKSCGIEAAASRGFLARLSCF